MNLGLSFTGGLNFSLFGDLNASLFGDLLVFAQTSVERKFMYARLEDQWQLMIGCAVLAVIVLFSILLYRRDAAELHWSVCVLLTVLRLTAFGLLFYIWLQPQISVTAMRTENSRVAVLIDVTQSMSWRDGEPTAPNTGPSRAEVVATALKQQKLIEELQQNHDVVVMRFFDHRLESVGQFKRRPLGSSATTEAKKPEPEPAATAESSGDSTSESSAAATGEATSESESTSESTADSTAAAEAAVLAAAKAAGTSDSDEPNPEDVDWAAELAPRGTETRVGEAVEHAVAQLRSGILAGVVVFTDGQSNVGLTPQAVVPFAVEANVPVFPVGIGSTHKPINLRVTDLAVQPRVYPGDDFEVKAYIQASGPTSVLQQTVQVQLVSRPAGTDTASDKEEDTEAIELDPNGEAQAVTFRMQAGDVGRRTLEVRVTPITGDTNPKDDRRTADVEIVERKTKVLLFAGGPGREYQFLRNQLYRDSTMSVDALLQIAQPGMSQDAAKLLDEFPTKASELAEYDCIVAFDPDWSVLSSDQIDLLERWVAEQSGGLIVTAGPVYTEKWTRRPEMSKILGLYPVEFNRRVSLLAGQFENREPRRILLSREGQEAQFLKIAENASLSQRAWDDFEGVFGYYSVRGKKDAATIYGRYDDPRASSNDEQPIYFCGQIYGSGRVFYMGSGEIWRLRSLDVPFFERYYTNLIRFVTQERLRRGSKRGVLLIERDSFVLGEPIIVQAQLFDREQKPLAVSQVTLDILMTGAEPIVIPLKANPSGRPGEFRGQFLPRQDGEYRLEVHLPDSDEEENLSRVIQVKLPDREMEHLERNDTALSTLATGTGGEYLIGTDNLHRLVEKLPPQTKFERQRERPIPMWDKPWMLGLICGLLGVEWLIRRLSKLA